MGKGRLEAFSDGVIAILITIMVLELKVPQSASWDGLRPLLPVFLSYVLSFVFLAVYWNNHHHLFHIIKHVNGTVLWANMHLLFWLSLVPFVTGWMGENQFATAPVVSYGFIMFMAGVAYYILVRALVALHGQDSDLAVAIGRDFKGKISVLIYLVGIPLAFFVTWAAILLFTLVLILWLLPDRRIEKVLSDETKA
jgi:uncharacterized membrane protein